MRLQQSKTLKRFLQRVPGAKRFGIYRYLPVFFVFGAALEYSMINWRVGEVNFYRTFKRRQVEDIVNEILLREEQQRSKTDNNNNKSSQAVAK